MAEVSDLLNVYFTAVILIIIFTLQAELLTVTGLINTFSNEGAAFAACLGIVEQLALWQCSTLMHPVILPSLGLLFQVPQSFHGQMFAVQAEGKTPTQRNGFSVETCSLCFIPASRIHRVQSQVHVLVLPVVGSQTGSGLVEQRWFLGLTAAFVLQFRLLSLWPPCAVQRRLQDSSERWVGLCRHGSAAQGGCPGNPNVSEATSGNVFIIFFLIFIFFCCICFLMEIKENLEAVQIKNEREVEYLLPYSEKLP